MLQSLFGSLAVRFDTVPRSSRHQNKTQGQGVSVLSVQLVVSFPVCMSVCERRSSSGRSTRCKGVDSKLPCVRFMEHPVCHATKWVCSLAPSGFEVERQGAL